MAAVNFRAFVVCANTSTTVQATKFDIKAGEAKEQRVDCPGNQRAVGGGGIQSGDPGKGFVEQSGPTDGSGTFRKTKDGDAPLVWKTQFRSQGGSKYFKAFAVCSRSSKARLEVTAGETSESSPGFDTGVLCPDGDPAIGGGMLHDRHAANLIVATPSGPLDSSGSSANTEAGDTPAYWYAGVDSRFFAGKVRAKVLAVCEPGV